MISTLADNYRDLIGQVGDNLGYGKGALNGEEAWSASTENRLKSYVKSGLRQFYKPPIIQGAAYTWSWLRPTATIAVPSGQSIVRLPDDFEGLVGEILVSVPAGTSWRRKLEINGRAREMLVKYPSQTGCPAHLSVEPVKGTTEFLGQRSQLVIAPIPDQDYVLQMRYTISAEMLNGDLPYAYGGVDHAETLLESCLAIAEERADDLMPQQQVHGPKFLACLAASISRDRERTTDTIGYVGDNSDDLERRRFGRPMSWSPLTVNGEVNE